MSTLSTVVAPRCSGAGRPRSSCHRAVTAAALPAALFWGLGRYDGCRASYRQARRRHETALGSGTVHASSAAGVSPLPAPLQKIVTAFQMVPDPMQRYKQLLFFASKLKPMAAELHTAENKVPGCVSQVWVFGTLSADGRVSFAADSDSQLTKGLAALLVEGLSGCTPLEILAVTPAFVTDLGLKQSLTPSRNNGFMNMLRTMQGQVLTLSRDVPAAAAAPPPETVRARMEIALQAGLHPESVVIRDDSSSHAGHAGGKGLRAGETHFSVEIVASAFEGLSPVARHRVVYALLDAEIKGGVHALQLSTKTPTEAKV